MTITLGHVLMLAAAVAAVFAVMNTATALRHRRPERGTPQYADVRTARRSAFYALGLALLFAGLCLTPLCSIDLLSIGA